MFFLSLYHVRLFFFEYYFIQEIKLYMDFFSEPVNRSSVVPIALMNTRTQQAVIIYEFPPPIKDLDRGYLPFCDK